MPRLLLSLALAGYARASGGDGHGDGAFEWAGIFSVGRSEYFWQAEKVNGAYADPAMKIAFLPATAATEAALHALEGEGGHALEEDCITVYNGGTITPAEDTCYSLSFETRSHSTVFRSERALLTRVEDRTHALGRGGSNPRRDATTGRRSGPNASTHDVTTTRLLKTH